MFGVMRVVPNHISSPIAYLTSAGIEDGFVAPKLSDFQMLRLNRFNGAIVCYRPISTPGWEMEAGVDPRAGRRYYYQSYVDKRRSACNYDSQESGRRTHGAYTLASLGPNLRRDNSSAIGGGYTLRNYDPTNGTISHGDVVRNQKVVFNIEH